MALATAVRREAHRRNETLQGVYTLALSLLLDEIALNPRTYPFREVDMRLLDVAAATLSIHPKDLQYAPAHDWHGL